MDELAANLISPALERLHLIEGKWSDTLPLWSIAVPQLAHLRLSSTKDDLAYPTLRDILMDLSKFTALRALIMFFMSM